MPDSAAQPACGETGIGVLFLDRRGNSAPGGPPDHRRGGVSAGPQHRHRPLGPKQLVHPADQLAREQRPARVLPPGSPVDRLRGQQDVPEVPGRQQRRLDASHRPHEHRLQTGCRLLELGGDRERGHEMAAGAAARDEHDLSRRRSPPGHPFGPAGAALARPRRRPMLIRIPVPRSEITWLERPYDMNGNVSPVVGMRPSDTAMCMNAVSPIVAVSPRARYWPNGSDAVRAMRKPSQQKRAKRNTTANTPMKPHSSPIVLKRKSEYAYGR